jgi:hypothetical protein
MIDAAGLESARRAAAFEERRSVARSVYVIASLYPKHYQREWERQQAFQYRVRLRPRLARP